MFNLPESVIIALELLEESGYECYIVGGCIRDLLMGHDVHDWDLTTDALPDEVIGVFNNFRVIRTGIVHGTVTVIIEGKPLEITTYRIDGKYSDNRHPDSVNYTRNLRDDLARRDFTVNAIAYSPKQGVIDIYGGCADIDNRIIRGVRDASVRFDEDALRILRALRFASTLGFAIEKNTSEAVFQKCRLLRNISAERINTELTKLLCGKNAGQILRDYNQVIEVVMPEIAPMFGFDQKNRHHCFDVWIHTVVTLEMVPAVPVLRWAALFHDIGKPSSISFDKNGEGHYYGHASRGCEIADEIMHRLKFDNRSRERILLLIKYHDTQIGTEEKGIKRWLGWFGDEFLLQLTALKRADNLAQSEQYRERQVKVDEIEAIIRRLIEAGECISLRDLDINGDDLLALGYEGKAIGDALSMLLEAVIDEVVENEREALTKYLKENGL